MISILVFQAFDCQVSEKSELFIFINIFIQTEVMLTIQKSIIEMGDPVW